MYICSIYDANKIIISYVHDIQHCIMITQHYIYIYINDIVYGSSLFNGSINHQLQGSVWNAHPKGNDPEMMENIADKYVYACIYIYMRYTVYVYTYIYI